MNRNQTPYISALKYHWLTPLYDSIARVTLRDSTFKRQLIEQAQIQNGQNILDLGCGTATLTLLIKELHPGTQVVGLDADPEVIAIAKAKAAESKLEIGLALGLSFKLPYPDNYFHRVFSSLMFHHLTPENKHRTLAEIYRVLHPSGELHVSDWGKAQNLAMRLAFLMVQLLDGFQTTAENVRGELPEMFRDAGFKEVQETSRSMTMFGTLSLYLAKKPAEANPQCFESLSS
jgi:ubiquinone/menaquinone biosynthesis C-methylase UbiE